MNCKICGTECREFYPKGVWFCDLCGLSSEQWDEFIAKRDKILSEDTKMKKMKNKKTDEISYFDEMELEKARKEGLKEVNKYKIMRYYPEVLEDLEECN